MDVKVLPPFDLEIIFDHTVTFVSDLQRPRITNSQSKSLQELVLPNLLGENEIIMPLPLTRTLLQTILAFVSRR